MYDPAHPGLIILHECIEPLGLTIPEAAAALGISTDNLSNLVTANTRLSPETALRLEKTFGGSARSWYQLQAAYDLFQAEKHAPDLQNARQLWPPPEQATALQQHNIDETYARPATYEYDPDASAVSIPVSAIIHLYRGLLGAAQIVAQQLAALESIGIPVIVGANGPTATQLNDFAQAIPIIRKMVPLTQSSNDAGTNKIAVPVSEVAQLQSGLQGAGQSVNKLFDTLEKHQVAGEANEFSFSDLNDLASAEYAIEDLDDFIRARLDLASATEPAT